MKTIINEVKVDIFIDINTMIIDDQFHFKDDPMLCRIVKRQCDVLGVKSDSGRYIRIFMIPSKDSCSDSCKLLDIRENGERRIVPLELIENMKEGDTVKIITPDGINLEMTANQLKHKCNYLGTFEEALRNQINKR